MRTNYQEIFENNRRWVAEHDKGYFSNLARDQQPGSLQRGNNFLGHIVGALSCELPKTLDETRCLV